MSTTKRGGVFVAIWRHDGTLFAGIAKTRTAAMMLLMEDINNEN
tara:strand:- start:1676 stop:1807 length:132 start_codon:yes stop_codon:yes gene_type:complete